MFSNVLFIDLSHIDFDDSAGENTKLNGIDLDERCDEINDYLDDVNHSSDEEKCNADKTECSYYKDGIPIYYEYKDAYQLFVLDDLKVGTNSLKYKVIAENGDGRVYTFNIIRKDADGKVVDNDIMPPQTGNTIYVIAVIMLVLSFGVGIYFYTKKIKNTI